MRPRKTFKIDRVGPGQPNGRWIESSPTKAAAVDYAQKVRPVDGFQVRVIDLRIGKVVWCSTI